MEGMQATAAITKKRSFMKKIVIYARGRLLKKKTEKINWEDVVAVIDQSAEEGETYEGVPVVCPDMLEELIYDYIVVFSSILFDEIYSELIASYFVPAEKIISWRLLLGEDTDRYLSAGYLQECVRSGSFCRILDCDISYLFQFVVTKESLGGKLVRLDGIGSNHYPILDNLYDHIYGSLCEVDFESYDVVLLWELPADLEDVGRLLNKAESCLLMLRCADVMGAGIQKTTEVLEQYGSVRVFQSSDGCFLELRRRHIHVVTSASIYVVTHRKYNVMNDDLYRPICVGNDYLNTEYLSEKTGKNISCLNEKINECTALYWIWKNTQDEYVGLNHYRRYFCDNRMQINGNFLRKERVVEILKKYDILLADIHKAGNVLEEIRGSVGNDSVFWEGYQLVRGGIEKNQPDYLDVFDHVMAGKREYICHLFVTKREILNAYCEWLFSFLIDAAEKMDVSGLDGNSKRVIGFFAERVLLVWLMKQDLRIKELPILYL